MKRLSAMTFVLVILAAASYFAAPLKAQPRIGPSPVARGLQLRDAADEQFFQGQFAEAAGTYERACIALAAAYPLERFPDGHPALISAVYGQALSARRLRQRNQFATFAQRAADMARRYYSRDRFPQGNLTLIRCLAAEAQAAEHSDLAVRQVEKAIEYGHTLFDHRTHRLGHRELALLYAQHAQLLADDGQYQRAEQTAQRAIAMAGTLARANPRDVPSVARAQRALAHVYIAQHNYQAAEAPLDWCARYHAERYGTKRNRIRLRSLVDALADVSFALAVNGKLDRACRYLETALRLASEGLSTSDVCDLERRLAALKFNQGRFTSARNILEKSLRDVEDIQLKGILLSDLASVCLATYDIAAANSCAHRATISLADSHNYQAQVYSRLTGAECHLYQGDSQKARDLLDEATQFAKSAGDGDGERSELLYHCYRELASYHLHFGDEQMCRLYLNMARHQATELPKPCQARLSAWQAFDRVALAHHSPSLINGLKPFRLTRAYEAGDIWAQFAYFDALTFEATASGELEIAKRHTTRSLHLAQKVFGRNDRDNQHPMLATFYLRLAETERNLGNYERAQTHLRSALNVTEAKNPNPGLAIENNVSAWRRLGTVNFDMGRWDIAFSSCEKRRSSNRR